MTEETLEHKVLDYALGMYTRDDRFSQVKNPMTQKQFHESIVRLYGKKAGEIASKLWADGCLFINNYGYINLSDRGYSLRDTGILPPRRKQKQKDTLECVLDRLWVLRKSEFTTWILKKGFVIVGSENKKEESI